jgi:Ca-activated chloride channel family protein
VRVHGLLVLAALAGSLHAQQPLEFRTGVEVVHLDVFVSRDGEPLTDLTSENFDVRDNGAPQDAHVVLRDEAPPLHALLVLDMSASVTGAHLDDLEAAAVDFLEGLGKGDRATLTTFSHRARLETGIGVDPGSLHFPTRGAGGGTALFDAVYAALQLADSREARPILVVFSDGEDRLSWLSAEQVELAARESDAVVFGIHARQAPIPSDGTPAGWTRLFDPSTQFLRKLTSQSGGQLWYAEQGDLRAAFRRVLAELQSHYLLRYEIPAQEACTAWHDLDVKLRNRKGKVRASRGYSVQCDASG